MLPIDNHSSRRAGRRLGSGLAALLVATAGFGLPATPALADPLGDGTATKAPSTAGRYVVRLTDAPLAAYDKTKAAAGQRLSRTTAAAGSYRSYLGRRRATVADKAGVKVGKAYDTTFNGFSAQLTAKQADTLRKTAGVAGVYQDKTVHALVSNTADELGLTGRGGVWQQQFGGDTHAGEGTIIGVIDSGYWPESKSFAALPTPRPDAATIAAKWHGVCDFGTVEKPKCNNKVIGARWYDNDGLSTMNPAEFLSPRDSHGHGTHTASTAAGLNGVHATVGGIDMGTITGMAPGARLAIYKALWSDGAGGAYGSTADILGAIEDAVADGVDVLNYSIGDDSEAWGPIDEAFLNAAAAGVFVAAAAGNAGPGEGTVDNTAPWVTTVAATEQDHRWLRTITLGNGTTYTGIGIGAALGSAPLIDSEVAGTSDSDGYYSAMCLPDWLDPAKVKGKIVLCARGISGRVAKSELVKSLGGVGMILYQPFWEAGDGLADFHAVPTAHVGQATGEAIRQYAAGGKGTAKLSAGAFTKVEAPAVASFSSSGPSSLSGGDLIKPDLGAPGADVVAAVSPAEHDGDFTMMSGTSMAAPHIAGIAALVKAKHPGWGPTAIQSALMTGSRDRTDKGNTISYVDEPATPLNYGSGEVVPAASLDPGLVYQSTAQQWQQFACGAYDNREDSNDWAEVPNCTGVTSMKSVDLNYPSIAFGNMVGAQSVKRTVTNVGKFKSRYVVKIEQPKGYTVKVSPATFEIKPGASVTFTVTVSHNGGAYDKPVAGNITWVDLLGHHVRSPILIRNTQIVAPASVTGSGGNGSQTIKIQKGWKGTLTAATAGLTAGTTTAFRLDGLAKGWDDTYETIPDPAPATMKVTKFHVPAGTLGSAVRIDSALPRCYWDDEHEGIPCGDFYAKVFDATGGFVDAQFMHNPHTATLQLPDGAGDYTLVVEQVDLGYLPAGETGQPYSLTVITPGAPGTTVGKFTASPSSSSAAAGATVGVTVRWSGLTAGQQYHGVLVVGDGKSVVQRIPVDITG
ncbi:subtilisin family serine protease/plastocyanin [Actinoplanes tereljensis]|uniref:Uncharacterized protein n=1 Tax=Paractinoplanes tereljensis TaxID=571912 RepID=A0A919TUG5_9ACTN|nr:S8 family serine peptidase [Actinoplanes tereljensis]GIF23658.1 hypothetical protein Ate02nite_63880 [Actinoplanes tereljensis]